MSLLWLGEQEHESSNLLISYCMSRRPRILEFVGLVTAARDLVVSKAFEQVLSIKTFSHCKVAFVGVKVGRDSYSFWKLREVVLMSLRLHEASNLLEGRHTLQARIMCWEATDAIEEGFPRAAHYARRCFYLARQVVRFHREAAYLFCWCGCSEPQWTWRHQNLITFIRMLWVPSFCRSSYLLKGISCLEIYREIV